MNLNDMYKTCRWCKWFKDGACLNEQAFEAGDDFEFFKFAEEGALSEAIREGFKGFKFEKLEQALFESKLSKKRIKEIMAVFFAELELDAQLHWTEAIDEQVMTALNNFDFGFEDGVYIKDPSEFSCKYFW
jgi:hypothetical protein